MKLDSLDDSIHLIAWVDHDGLFGGWVAQDDAVALKGSHGEYVENDTHVVDG